MLLVVVVDGALAAAADVKVVAPASVVPVIAGVLAAVILATLNASVPDDVAACTIEVRAACIAEEVSDGLVEPVRLELDPKGTCEVVTITVLGPPDELYSSSSDTVELRKDAALDAATSVGVAVAVTNAVVTLGWALLDANTSVATADVDAPEPEDALWWPSDDEVEPRFEGLVDVRTLEASTPDDEVANAIVVGTEGIVEEASNALDEVDSLTLGPEEACAESTATELLDVTATVAIGVVVFEPSEDDVGLRVEEKLNADALKSFESDDDADSEVVIGTMCVVDALADVLVEVINPELGPREACSKVTVKLVGELLDVATPDTKSVVVDVRTVNED